MYCLEFSKFCREKKMRQTEWHLETSTTLFYYIFMKQSKRSKFLTLILHISTIKYATHSKRLLTISNKLWCHIHGTFRVKQISGVNKTKLKREILKLCNTETAITLKHSESWNNIKYYLTNLKHHSINENNINEIFFSTTSVKLFTRNI